MKALFRPFILAVALLSFAAPVATAADDPTCDAQGKSTAQLRGMLASPTVAQYCPPGTVDEIEAELGDTDGAGEVAGTKDDTPPTSGDVAPARETAEVASADNLPFTGAEMGTFAVLGAVLILTGFVLRRSGGQSERV
jgi:hypothetical protein